MLSLLQDHKLGLSLLNISEFVEILEALLISTEEGATVNKLTKFKMPREKSSQKFVSYVKKVNKLEYSKNLSSTSWLDVSLVLRFLSFYIYIYIYICIHTYKLYYLLHPGGCGSNFSAKLLLILFSIQSFSLQLCSFLLGTFSMCSL